MRERTVNAVPEHLTTKVIVRDNCVKEAASAKGEYHDERKNDKKKPASAEHAFMISSELMKAPLLLCLPLFFFAASAYAHSVGQSFEQKVGEYTVDVGYDAVSTIAVDDPVRFDFNLWNSDKTKNIPFTSVWVQLIGPDKRVVFTGDIIQPDIGLATASYRFMQIGTYTLYLRYEHVDDSIAETSFSIPVVAGDTFGGFGTTGGMTSLIAGIVIGAALVFFLLRRRS